MQVKDPNVKLDYEDDLQSLTDDDDDSFSPNLNEQLQKYMDFKKRKPSKALSTNQKLIKKLINKNPKLQKLYRKTLN